MSDISFFWKLRAKAIRGSRICRFLAKFIRLRYGCAVPTTSDITPFIAPHGFYGIFISEKAKIGENCCIFQQVTIGENNIKGSKRYGAPVIGKNVYIGAGAKIIGNVIIGDNVRIGANAVVVDDVPSNSTVVMEKPRIILRAMDDARKQ